MTAVTTANLSQVLQLEVSVVVRLAERTMSVTEVVRLVPGSILELPKNAEAELDLMVHDKVIGAGNAVKVGENFGLKLTFLGDVRARLEAIAAQQSAASSQDDEAASLAEALLAGQL